MQRTARGSCIALLVGGALLAAALAQPAQGRHGATEFTKGGTLRIGSPVEPDSLDPALGYTSHAWSIEYATCAKLFNFPDAAGVEGTRVIPEVVNRSTVSRDGKTYTFELRKTFRFHTGAPVTAASFAEAFHRDASLKTDFQGAAYLHEIVGADAVLAGKATAIAGVRVLGPYRLQFRLTKPVGDFTARLTMPFFCPLLPKTPLVEMNTPPGSGPYYVAERVLNRQTVLRRNPYYRGDRPANVDQTTITVGVKPDDCVLAVEQDRLDTCLVTLPRLPDATLRRIVQQYGINKPGGQFFVAPGSATWFFAFNHDRPAFKGPGQIPLAKAINYAIDRPALARAFAYLSGRRDDQMLPPALGPDASVYPIRGADPATARKWLKKASVKPTRLVLYTWSTPFGLGVAGVFAFDLKQIGIDVEVKTYEQTTLGEKIGTRGEPFDVALSPWGWDYPDGGSFFIPLLGPLHLTDNGNVSYFDDPKTIAAIAKASGLTGDARRAAWANLDVDLMRNNPPWAPIIHTTLRAFVSKSYGCFLAHPTYSGGGVGDLAAACKK